MDTQFRKDICRRFCRYFKAEKFDDPGCGALAPLLEHISRTGWDELYALEFNPAYPLYAIHGDDPRLVEICEKCSYPPLDCDFRNPEVSNDDCAPCGALCGIAGLISTGRW